MKWEVNRGNNNCISQCGVGYVVIPDEENVADYVQRCYRNSTISISGGYDATYMHNVKVVDGVLDKIKFPSEDDNMGSPVVWIRDSFTNRPVVIGTVNPAGVSNMTLTNQQRIVQETAESVVEMFLDALNGKMNISAKGGDNVPAEVVVQATSGASSGDVVRLVSKDKITGECKTLSFNLTKDIELIINNGQEDIIKINADEEVTKYTDHWGNVLIMDETETHFTDKWGNDTVADKDKVQFTNQWKDTVVFNDNEVHLTDHNSNEAIFNADNTQFLTKKFNVGQGNEQMVLGNTLVKLLGRILDGICSLTVVTHAGPSGTPINAATFTAIKSELETALSKLSNTD